MHRQVFFAVCLILNVFPLLGTRSWAENPQSPLAVQQLPQDQTAARIGQLAASQFAVRREAFLALWKSGRESLPLISQAKSSSERQVAEAVTILEMLIELDIAPEKPENSARLFDIIANPSAPAIVELCEKKLWQVAERILLANSGLVQKFQEPYGRYLLGRIVELGLEQGDPKLAWPIIRQVTPAPLNSWIAEKAGLEISAEQASDSFFKAYHLYFAGDVDAALAVETPVVVQIPMIARSARWSRLLDEPILRAMAGRQQTPSQLAVMAVLHEVAGDLPRSREIWDELITANVDFLDEAKSEAIIDPASESALRILRTIDAGGMGGQTIKNQFLAALLFSGRAEPIEQYLMEQDKGSAFGFYLAGNDYAHAFETIGLEPDLKNFDDWLAARKSLILAELGQRTPDTRHFDEATRLCATLSGLGYRVEAEHVLDELVELARLSRGKQEELWSRSLLGWLGRSEARALALQAAKSEFERMSSECQAAVLKGLFPEFEDAALALWLTAPADNKQANWENLERLYHFDRSHFGKNSQSLISSWLRRAVEELSKDQLEAQHLIAIGDIAVGFGDSDLAIELLTVDLSRSSGNSSLINQQWLHAARILVERGKPAEALPLFSGVRKSGSNLQRAYCDEIQALLLSGHFEQANLLEQSRWLRPLATTRFYQGYNYLQAAREFTVDHLYERAAEYAEAAFLLADSGSMDVYWAAGDYATILGEQGDHMRNADVQRAAWVESLQPYASSMQYMISNGYFSSLRFSAQKEKLSRAVACIESGDLTGALHNIEIGYRLQPQDIEMVVQCFPRLQKAGESKHADELFDMYEREMLQQIEDWPNDATALNNLAWMYSQCDRKLDEALSLVRKAVDLAPTSAIFLDTLAEVEFRLGRIDSALVTMRNCVRLDPRERHYRDNLVRFRGGEK